MNLVGLTGKEREVMRYVFYHRRGVPPPADVELIRRENVVDETSQKAFLVELVHDLGELKSKLLSLDWVISEERFYELG